MIADRALPTLLMTLLLLILGSPAVAASGPAASSAAGLRVVGERFVLTLSDGRRLTSPDLVGAELQMPDGQALRIDAIAPSREQPDVLLHSFSVRDATTGGWMPACDADAYGRRAGFPVAGRWTGDGRFVRDAAHWFLTCTSGAQGKCVLWGYNPWGRGPRGESLSLYYQACQHTVRADYDGRGEAHTKNGTDLDVSDRLGIQTADSRADPRFAFEAGWGPSGAVCVARTRWPDLLTREKLLAAAPSLGGPCDEATAKRKGALIFTRVKITPSVSEPVSMRDAVPVPVAPIAAARLGAIRLFAAIESGQVDTVSDQSVHAVKAGVDFSLQRIAMHAELAAAFNGGGRLANSTRAFLTSTVRF